MVVVVWEMTEKEMEMEILLKTDKKALMAKPFKLSHIGT